MSLHSKTNRNYANNKGSLSIMKMKYPNNDEIAQRIKSIRKSYRLSQLEFAERLGVTKPIVVAFEKALIVFDEEIINDICYEFDIVKDWIINGDKDTVL
jgi:DNA-binding XRE family transcriptional regulator